MGSRISRQHDREEFKEYMNWIAQNHLEHEETVSRFRRTVSTKTEDYEKVMCLYKWQKRVQADYSTSAGCVADLVGAMRMAADGVRVNRVDIY